MELQKVKSENYKFAIQKTLKTLVSEEELEDIKDGLFLELSEGSFLYSIIENGEDVGFIIVTPLPDEDESSNKIEILSVDEIFIQSGKQSNLVAEIIARDLKKLSKEFKSKQIEIIISQAIAWMGDILQDNGYLCTEVKLEKVLPTPNNLADVLELIKDCTPIDRIVQVLLEKEEEFQAEILEEVDEIVDLLEEGWVPVIVVVTYEPESDKVNDIVEGSNQILKWDDYSLVYRGA